MQIPTTKTEIAQKAITTAVAMTVAKFSRDRIAEHTSYDPDGIPVKLATGVAGQLVAQSVAPYTDKAVVNAVSKIQTWRQNRKDKKNSEEK